MVIGKTALLATTIGIVFVVAAVAIYAAHPDFIFGNPFFQGLEGRSGQDKTPSGSPSSDNPGGIDNSQLNSQLSPPSPPPSQESPPAGGNLAGVAPQPTGLPVDERSSSGGGGGGGGGSSGGGDIPDPGTPVMTPIPDRYVNQTELIMFAVSATDSAGKSLTYGANNVPYNASFDSGTHVFSWVPLTSQHGWYIVNFSASNGVHNGYGDGRCYVYNIGNQPPVWTITPEQEVNETEQLSFQVSAIDPDGDPITYSAAYLPANATFNTSTQIFTWTPVLGQEGEYNVTFSASDGLLKADMEVEIDVESGEGPTPVPEFPLPGVPVAILAAVALLISIIRSKKPGE